MEYYSSLKERTYCSNTEASASQIHTLCVLSPNCVPKHHRINTSVSAHLFWLRFSRSGAVQRVKADYVRPVCRGPKGKPPSSPEPANRTTAAAC